METSTKNRRKRNTATGITAGQTGRFLVTGAAITQTVTHGIRGPERQGIGGVAATIALALAEAGNQVTLVTSTGWGSRGPGCGNSWRTPPSTPSSANRGPRRATPTITRRGEQIRA